MTGLEKIIARIADEAEAEAAKIMSAAEDKSRAILKDYDYRATLECQRIEKESADARQSIIMRAKSSAAVERRNRLLSVEGEMVDKAFDMAMSEILGYPHDKYLDMLITLLSNALTGYIETADKNLKLYGEADEIDGYEVLLNSKDRDAYAAELIDGLRKTVIGRIDSAELDRVSVSGDTVNISGGLVLRCGNVECNCSLEKLFTAARPQIEEKVRKIIGGSKA